MKRISEVKEEIKKFYKEENIDHILCLILNIPLKEIYKDEILLGEEKFKEIINIFKKIDEGYPAIYLTKKTFFCDMEFYVEEGIFIPRPETETFLDNLVNFLKDKKIYPKKILDLGCGSGCIAISLKKFFEDSEVFASDLNKKACKITLKNSKINNLKINVICADLFSSFKEKFDLIVSNPPYLSHYEYKNLPKNVKWEPKEALFGGEDGLLFYKKIFNEAKNFLNENGILALEINPFLEEKIKNISKDFILIKEIYDLNGFKRGLVFNLSFINFP